MDVPRVQKSLHPCIKFFLDVQIHLKKTVLGYQFHGIDVWKPSSGLLLQDKAYQYLPVVVS